jgi:hypothetical protein
VRAKYGAYLEHLRSVRAKYDDPRRVKDLADRFEAGLTTAEKAALVVLLGKRKGRQ